MYQPTTELRKSIEEFDIDIMFKKVTIERINDELCKTLAKGDIDYLIQDNFISKIIPEFNEFKDKEYSVMVLKHIAKFVRLARDEKLYPLEFLLGALLHDVGKSTTGTYSNSKNRWQFLTHEQSSTRIAKDVLTRLKFSNKIIKNVIFLIENHMKIKFFNFENPRSFIKFLLVHGEEDVLKLIMFNYLDWTSKPIEDIERLDVYNKHRQLIDQFVQWTKVINSCKNNYKDEYKNIAINIGKNKKILNIHKNNTILGERVRFIKNVYYKN